MYISKDLIARFIFIQLIVVMVVLFANVASAADWQYVATNGTEKIGNEISYDKASVVNNGATRKVWLKFHGVGTDARKGDSKQLWSLRCHDRQYKILVFLDEKGRDLAPDLDHSYADIQPESWIEDLLTDVCVH